ncbi:MAG: 6-phosphogluconolactonase [Gemmatimonadaceae bacterium]
MTERIPGANAPSWLVVGDREELVDALVRAARPLASAGIESRGYWTIAIPGGSVVEQLLGPLVRAPLDWEHAHVFWCDERAVAPTDPQSNWGLAQGLLESTRRLGAQLHRMPADQTDLSKAAADYAAELESVAGHPPQLDIVLLGVGEDGHVASIFPDTRRRLTRDRWWSRCRLPKPPAQRMSLALDVLARARLTCVAAFGAGKADVVRRAMGPACDLPVGHVLRYAARPMLLADSAAARAAVA